MKAPDFSLVDIKSGQKVNFSDFQNRPLMLTFWVSWCPDCQRDLPKKAEFYRSLNEESLAFATINVTGREGDPADGPVFAEKHGLPFPVLLDVGTKTYDAYGCTSVPTTVLINRQGEVVEQFDDQTPFPEIVAALPGIL